MATEALPREPSAAPEDGGGATGERQARRAPATAVLVLTLLASLVVLVCAAALPVAPVRHDRPVVTWPQDPAAPTSTTLMLVSHRPAALTLSTTCATARAAAERGDGLLLATMRPSSSQAAAQGLLWWVRDGQLRLDVAGELVDTQPVPSGDCSLQVVTTPDGAGVQLLRDEQPVGEPTTVLPEVDSLVTSLTTLDQGSGEQLSASVAVNDEFASSPTPLKLALVALLLLAGLLALVGVGLLDRWRPGGPADTTDTAPGEPPLAAVTRWRTTLRPRPADGAVLLLVVAWAFLAPMTDDDGYYAAMARNVAASGYVGQYYQLYDQSFVPLTWPWYALSWWTGVADTPLGLRVPAVVLGLLTWVGVRRCADLLLGAHPRWGSPDASPGAQRVRGRVTALLALAFATAWTPYVMGVRPEAISAAASVAVLTGVLTTLRTGRQLPVAVAVVVAALSCAAHPTGAVAVAPLLAACPALWRRLRAGRGERAGVTVARLVTIIAPGAMVTAAGFADGTLYDFRRGREVFEAIQQPDTWTKEFIRYDFLFNEGIPMGAYAKRTTVVLALLAALVGLLLVAASRARRAGEVGAGEVGAGEVGAAEVGAARDAAAGTRTTDIRPGADGTAAGTTALALLAATTVLAFVTLWVTPSKWTHHFGSLAGLTPLLLTALLLLGPGLARRVLPGRGGGAAGLAVVAGVVAVASVAMAGPNLWPYDDQLGMPHPGVSPYLSVVSLRSPVWWSLGAVVVAAALLLQRRRAARGTDVPVAGAAADAAAADAPRGTAAPLAPRVAAVTAVALMVVSTTYLVGSFAVAAVTTLDTYSPGAAMLTDPANRDCGAAGAVSVADDVRAVPLEPAAGVDDRPRSTPERVFLEGSGWWQNDPPPGTAAAPGAGPAPRVTGLFGSLGGGEAETGELRTGWYDLAGALAGTPGTGGLPAAPDDPATAVTVLVTGDLTETGGNTLVAEYGVLDDAADGGVRVTTVEPLGDGASTTEWRAVRLGDAPETGPGPDGVPGTDDDPALRRTAVPDVDAPDAGGAGGPEDGFVYDQDLAAAAQVVRLRAVDAATGPGGWLAVGAPAAAPVTTMSAYVPRDAVVATAWQRTYLFPCQEQVLTGHGISTRPEYAVLIGSGALDGINDSVWQAGRGGLYAQVPEAGTLVQPSSWYTDTPEVGWGQLARIEYAYPDGAYDVDLVPEVRSGLVGPTVPDIGQG